MDGLAVPIPTLPSVSIRNLFTPSFWSYILNGEPVDADSNPYNLTDGNNLVSYPCDNAIPIAEAIPSSETFLDAIIGEGVAASYLDGVGWVGSLGNLQSGDGYWFQANTNVCFQYECSE